MKVFLFPVLIRVPAVLLFVIVAGRASAYSADDSLQNLLPQDNLPAYFVSTFDDLMWSKWNITGDWVGDWQNDATAFAPELLFQVDEAIGDSPGPFYQRAIQTGVWERHLIIRLQSISQFHPWFSQFCSFKPDIPMVASV